MAPPTPIQKTLRTAQALAEAQLIAPAARRGIEKVAARYAVSVSPTVRELIDLDNPADPLARQFVPTSAELAEAPREDPDPIGDEAFSPVPGLVHRYRDRVLLKLLHTCPVYCRYCFRRDRVGTSEPPLSQDQIETALAYVRSHKEIWEVILTGGDPFLLSPRRMGDVIRQLDSVDHLGVVRIHTRVPIVDPARVNDHLVTALAADKAVYVIVHCNHPHELSPAAIKAIGRLVNAGIPVLSQSVLLKGVNDDAATLEALFRALVRNRVKPYYLHHPDRAPGTQHFRPSLKRGRALVDGLRGDVSGLCQPTYVLDIPGGHGKVPAAPARVTDTGDGGYQVRDRRGCGHAYEDEPEDSPPFASA